MSWRTKDKMTIKDGKFYKNNQLVRAEHGNLEQIELLKKVSEMMNEGIVPEIRIQQVVTFEFDCVCGALNEFHFDPFDIDDNPEYMLRGQKQCCHYCNLEYKVFDDKDNGLMIRINEKEKTV